MNKLSNFAPNKATVAVASLVAAIFAVSAGSNAFADDAVTAAFTSVQSQLAGYATAGVAMVIAVLVIGVGVSMVVRWAKRAAKA